MVESEKQSSKNVAEFNQLVEDVEKVDPKAANYIRWRFKDLVPYELSGKLAALFNWEDTMQGYRYWSKIAQKVSAMRDGKNEHLTVSKIRETVNVTEFKQLVEDVEKIDTAAAKYLRLWSRDISPDKLSGRLVALFPWGDSPQRGKYWMEINRRLNDMRAVEEFIRVPQKNRAPRELTMEDLRRDCFPAEYTWHTRQPEKEPVVEKDPPIRDLVAKIISHRKGLMDF